MITNRESESEFSLLKHGGWGDMSNEGLRSVLWNRARRQITRDMWFLTCAVSYWHFYRTCDMYNCTYASLPWRMSRWHCRLAVASEGDYFQCLLRPTSELIHSSAWHWITCTVFLTNAIPRIVLSLCCNALKSTTRNTYAAPSIFVESPPSGSHNFWYIYIINC